MTGAFDDRLRQRVTMWSDDLMNKYPFVTREASLRAIEYGVAVGELRPGGFAALLKERPADLTKLRRVMNAAVVFCRLFTSLPLLERLRGPDGELPAAAEELLAMDDRTYPTVVRSLLARGVNVQRWLAATEAEPVSGDARGYVLDFLEEARLADLAAEAYVDSGWASRYFPREAGSGQTRKFGSRKEWH